MTLDEAIEILTDSYHHHYNLITQDEKDAIKLGIEALKEVKQHRALFGRRAMPILLGETERRD